LNKIQWKFFSKYKNSDILLAVSQDKVVWQYTNAETGVSVFWKETKQSQCLDMCVDKNFRWQGIITKLSNQFYSWKTFDFSFGFSNAQGVKIDKHASWYRYNIIWALTNIYIFPFMFFSKRQHNFSDISLFWEIQNDTPLKYQIHKDKKYLTWRYFENPETDTYSKQSITSLSGKFQGYIVFKTIWKRIYIMDITLQDHSEINSILKSFVAFSKSKRIYFIVYTTLYNSHWKNIFWWYRCIKRKRRDAFFTVRKNTNTHNDVFVSDNWLIQLWDVI
jgi:hypothetical protein